MNARPQLDWVSQQNDVQLVVLGPDDVVAKAVDPEYAPYLVARFNAHDELVDTVSHLVKWHDQLQPADIQRARDVLAKVGAA